MLSVSGDFPFSLPLAYLIGRLTVCCDVRFAVCRVLLSKVHARARHARLVADKSLASFSILVRHVRHARIPNGLTGVRAPFPSPPSLPSPCPSFLAFLFPSPYFHFTLPFPHPLEVGSPNCG